MRQKLVNHFAWAWPVAVLLLMIATSQTVRSEEWRIKPAELTLRAYWQQAGGKDDITLVVLHGTLAHNRMEIIQGLQEVFAERGLSSLAINLALGMDARASSNYPCAHAHSHKHEDAMAELDAWVQELTGKGYSRLVVIGHSRGGNQVARYLKTYKGEAIVAGILIAPMVSNRQPDATESRILAQSQNHSWLDDVTLLYCNNARVSSASYRSYYTPNEDFDSLFVAQYVRQPLLLFAGSEDQIVAELPQRFATLRAAGRLEHVEYHLLDGADHFFRDLFLEDVADITEEFLDQL